MADDYTPTTERIKKLATDWIDVGGEVDEAGFDRWLSVTRESIVAEVIDWHKQNHLRFLRLHRGAPTTYDMYREWTEHFGLPVEADKAEHTVTLPYRDERSIADAVAKRAEADQ